MEVSHGSYTTVKEPRIQKGLYTKDFGVGFYCTQLKRRNGQPHGYDIVIGAMANDQIYNYISDFIRGIITREQFWALAKFKYPTHQIAFCTDAALKCLTFKSVYSL